MYAVYVTILSNVSLAVYMKILICSVFSASCIAVNEHCRTVEEKMVRCTLSTCQLHITSFPYITISCIKTYI